jgi:hypothetical protein
VLHVVAAQQDQLALAVEVVDVDDAETRLPGAAPVLPREHEPPAREPPEHDAEHGDEHQDDHEGDHVGGRGGFWDAETG